MGTNYYVKTNKKILQDGFLKNQILHIGKSSFGWYFSLHVIPQFDLNTFEDWEKFLKDKTIRDEYGRKVSYDQMIKIILRDVEDGLFGTKKSGEYTEGLCEDNKFYKTYVGKRGLHYVQDHDAFKVTDKCITLVSGEFS